jgi:hypothetical protein
MPIEYVIYGEGEEVAVRASLTQVGTQWVVRVEERGEKVRAITEDSAAVAVMRMRSDLAGAKSWAFGMGRLIPHGIYNMVRDHHFAVCQLEQILNPTGPRFVEWSKEDLAAFQVPANLFA